MDPSADLLKNAANYPVGWAVGLALGLPLAVFVLTEVSTRLRRSGSPIARTIALVRMLLLPTVAAELFLKMVVGLPEDHFASLMATTLAWVVGLFVALTLVNDVLFGTASEESWRARVPLLVRDLTRVALVAIGAAIIYSQVWGKSLEGAITALGVTSIVLGLALQEPLGNIISGLMLMFERPLKLGDEVIVDEITGRVIEINWRSVHILTLHDGVRIVPNSELYKSSFNNLSRPTHLRTEKIELGFSYDDPPNRVKEVLLAILRETPGILKSPSPAVRTHSYGDFSILYWVTFSVARTDDLIPTRDDFMTRLWYAVRRHGLNMPFPTQTSINVDRKDLDAESLATSRPADVLATLPTFKLLGDGPVDEASEAGLRMRSYASGEVVAREGERIEGLHIVISGTAVLTVRALEGPVREVARVGRGEYFGEGSILAELPSDVTVTAETDLELVVVGPDAMFRLLGRAPALGRQLGDLMDGRRRAALAARREAPGRAR